MNQQAVFSIIPVEKYQLSDFIVSAANRIAFNIITNWPEEIWGNIPYKNALLLIGPKSSGKTFLANIWQQRGQELSIQNKQHIIEDIDNIKSEEELLHSFNSSYENNKFLLMTASKFPKFQLPDLSSRIKSINKIDINQPDDELLKMLIFKMFSDHSLKVNAEVINYLIKMLPREFAAVKSTIDIINEKALSGKRKITIPFVKEISCLT